MSDTGNDDQHRDHNEHDGVVPILPPNAPQVKRNGFTRWIARGILRLGGWRVMGSFPNIPKLVMIGAPHSSNWDAVWAFAAKVAMGLDVRILVKDSVFRVPGLGWMCRRLGMMPVDRSAPAGVIEQAAALIRGQERFWYGLAPEGTRKRVERWKTGFWKIAKAAEVPILGVYLHYPERVIGIGPLFHPTDDMAADIAAIRKWYLPWEGKHHGTQ